MGSHRLISDHRSAKQKVSDMGEDTNRIGTFCGPEVALFGDLLEKHKEGGWVSRWVNIAKAWHRCINNWRNSACPA